MAHVVSFEIEYVNGVSFAAGDDKNESEWPPHPDRFFLALVSAWACDEDPAEAKALKWIESLDPPTVSVPTDVGKRHTYESYVPATGNSELLETKNSTSKDQRSGKGYIVADVKKTPIVDIKTQMLRQARYFPATIMPDNSRSVWFSWKADNAVPDTMNDLSSLTRKMSSLGHPASLVRVAVYNKEPPEDLCTYVANADQTTKDVFLRCPHSGRFDEVYNGFKDACDSTISDNSSRPVVMWHPKRSRETPYTIKTNNIELSGPYDENWIVFGFAHNSFVPELVSFPILADRLKKALLSHCQEPIPESISGHKPNKEPSENPHMAIVPLVNSGWPHSDGNVKGIGIIMPTKDKRGVQDRDVLERTVDKFMHQGGRLTFGRAGETRVSRALKNTMKSLDVGRYTRVGKEWVTVTPIVLDGHYRDRPNRRYSDIISKSCIRAGLPKPHLIHVSKQPYITGSHPAYFNNVDRVDHQRKIISAPQQRGWRHPKRGRFDNVGLIHARIVFSVPIRGPIVLGRGRHYGLGLCMQVQNNE